MSKETWVIAFHCGDSTVEAAEAIAAWKVGSLDNARQFDDLIAKFISNHPDPYVRQNAFTTITEVFDPPPATPQQLAELGRPLGPNESAADVGRMMRTIQARLDGQDDPEDFLPQEFVDADFETTRQRLLEELGP